MVWHILREYENSLTDLQIVGTDEAQKEILSACFAFSETAQLKANQNLIIICEKTKDILSLYEKIKLIFFQAPIYICCYPHYSLWGKERFQNPLTYINYRTQTLACLSLNDKPAIIITSLPGLGQLTLASECLKDSALTLSVGEEKDWDELLAALEKLGFRGTSSVVEKGTYSLRGGILDIFPPLLDKPLRVEFFADEISSMRIFSTKDQRSIGSLSSAYISAASECLFEEVDKKSNSQKLYDELLKQQVPQIERDGIMRNFSENYRFNGYLAFQPLFRSSSTLFAYFAKKDTSFIFWSDPNSYFKSYENFLADCHSFYQKDTAAHKPTMPVDQHFIPSQELQEIFENKKLTYFSSLTFLNRKSTQIGLSIAENSKLWTSDKKIPWYKKAQDILIDGGRCFILTANELEIERTKSLFKDFNPHLTSNTVIPNYLSNKEQLVIGYGSISYPFWEKDTQTLWLNASDLIPLSQTAKINTTNEDLQRIISSFNELQIGDYVVHVTHGIGSYLGIKRLTVDDHLEDYIVIQYAQNDKVYLPVDKLNLLQRYQAGEESSKKVSLDKLGGSSWEHKKQRTYKAIKDIAASLLRMEAQRSMARSYCYAQPSKDYESFVNDFPYQETSDQLRTIAEIEHDLRLTKPMDRLIVGDVGFGKTEVALRTIMRSVLEGFQVLVLVPTTVLCYQHFQTFWDRLNKYGVEIAQIHRFIKPTEQKAILAKLSEGQIDVLIGTHRLLAKDITPKRLGLLIIDEEQRFGVMHKEKIKTLRHNADVLTLTATPIPRTLHMALAGLRDISLITTPPQNRRPVQTMVAHFDANLIKEAIEAELARGGQVFFVHNRVTDIEEITTFLANLVPSATFGIGHGQMREQQLEKVIIDFIEGRFQVLVCTTIIESGVDMPNVNTLIVNQAQAFGLAQLYQLRGRVGRSPVQAYAYFLVKSGHSLSPEAGRRLEAIVAHQALGSGFHLANVDLEIRGAGNLLGGEQSGHVAAVGLELYTDMLAKEIKALRGEKTVERPDPELKLKVSALIPNSYVISERERLSTYKKIFMATTQDIIDQIASELLDRYGTMPTEVRKLLLVASIKLVLKNLNATHLSKHSNTVIEIRFDSLSEQQIGRLLVNSREKPQNYRLTPDYRLLLQIELSNKSQQTSEEEGLKLILSLLSKLC